MPANNARAAASAAPAWRQDDPICEYLRPIFDALLLPGPGEIAVAVSGGPDSLALMHLLRDWARAREILVTVLTVDHGLRPAAAAEAQQVVAIAQALGLRAQVLTPPPLPRPGNLLAAARTRRYAALSEACRQRGIATCLLAHHGDDQCETVLHARARGETADGDSGMAMRFVHRGVTFVRPLLGVRKAHLLRWLSTRDIPWIEDPTNADPRYARTRARSQLQAQPQLAAALLAQCRAAGRARQARDDEARAAQSRVGMATAAGALAFDLDAWTKEAQTLRLRLIADALRCVSGADFRPRQGDTARVAESLNHRDDIVRTLHGCLLLQRGPQLTIRREPARVMPPIALREGMDTWWDARWRIRTGAMVAGLMLGAWRDCPHPRPPHQNATEIDASTPCVWSLAPGAMLPYIPTVNHIATTPLPAVLCDFAPANPWPATPFAWFHFPDYSE